MSLQLPRGRGLCVLDVAVPWLGMKKKKFAYQNVEMMWKLHRPEGAGQGEDVFS